MHALEQIVHVQLSLQIQALQRLQVEHGTIPIDRGVLWQLSQALYDQLVQLLIGQFQQERVLRRGVVDVGIGFALEARQVHIADRVGERIAIPGPQRPTHQQQLCTVIVDVVEAVVVVVEAVEAAIVDVVQLAQLGKVLK